MQLNLKKLLFVWMLMSPGLVLAQNKVGNGGNSIVCEKAGKKTARLLDFYEADLIPVAKASGYEEILKEKLEALRAAAPKLAQQYLDRLPQMLKEVELKADVRLVKVEDSLHVFEPEDKGCELVQTAIRKDKTVAGEKRFVINKGTWGQMSEVDRAGLISHEIIYEHLSRLGEKDSIKVRKLNAVIFGNKVIAGSEFWDLIHQLKLPVYP